VPGGFGACFWNPGAELVGCRRGRGTNLLSNCETVQVLEANKSALAQYRGTKEKSKPAISPGAAY